MQDSSWGYISDSQKGENLLEAVEMLGLGLVTDTTAPTRTVLAEIPAQASPELRTLIMQPGLI